jgi:hypothetical protein
MWLERQVAKLVGVTPSEAGGEAATKDRETLFRKAEESIRIVSSTLPERGPLIEAAQRGVSVEVITTQGQSFSDIIQLITKGISVYELGQEPHREFDIVDEKHFRAQEPDAGQRQNRPLQYVVRGFTHISEYLQRFAAYKARAIPYTIP